MKKIFYTIFIFLLGFFSYYLVDKYNVTSVDPQTYLKLSSETTVDGSVNKFITYVEFDGEEFSPNKVKIGKGDYLAITNTSKDKQMWLVSTNSDLATVRGYAEGERLSVNLSEPGDYLVATKNSPEKTLEVVVVD